MKLNREREEEVIRFTQEMVRCPGFSGDESATAAVVARQMKKLGFDTVEVDRWGSVIGVRRGARPGPTFVFDGHMDVVPIHMPELWRCEPYGAEIADGKIWGIGTSDMKSGLAACLCAAAFVDRAEIAGTIVVTATVAEELMIGRGLGKILEGRKVDAVMTCEPTRAKRLAVAGVGRTTVEMSVHGLVAHSSQPHLGDNAVYRAMDASERIRKMPRRQDAFFGTDVIELVEIKSRPSPGNGSVPDHCWVLWECRLFPGETRETFLNRFHAAIKGFHGAEKVNLKIGRIVIDCYTGERLDCEDFLKAWTTPPEEPFRKLVEQALLQTGIQAEPVIFRGCTNANISAGEMGIPSLVYGPGNLDLAHKPNEHVEIEELLLSVKAYGRMIELMDQYG
ncbi:MAG: M20/M25/M40 family metallo-hydrolase [Anaerolineaceae bacterium]|nr:M20/M25/M40 family metallo-hydrolase [Anaerolineaceae bacterium]